MEKLNFDGLLAAFDNYADLISEQANIILQKISSGRAPDKEEIDLFNSALLRLNHNYEEISKRAKECMEGYEDSLSVSEYAEGVKNSQAALTERLESAKATLDRFMSISSCAEAYEKALLPFQNQAKALYESISAGDTGALDDTLIASSADMVAAVEAGGDVEQDVLDRIEENLSPKIYIGVQKKEYFFQQTLVENPEITVGEEEEGACACETVESEAVAEAEVAEEKAEEVEAVAEEEAQPKAEENAEAVTEEGCTCAQSLLLTCLPKDYAFGEFATAPGVNETKKTGAKIFEKDVMVGYYEIQINIIRAVATEGYIAESTYSRHGDSFQIAAATIALENLTAKGYLRKYQLTPYEPIWCGTTRLDQALSKAESRKVVRIKKEKVLKSETYISDEVASVCARTIQAKTQSDVCAAIDSVHTGEILTQRNLGKKCFALLIAPNNGEKHTAFLYGNLLRDNEMDDSFDACMEEIRNEKLSYRCSVFCGVNLGHAKKTAEGILDFMGDTLNGGKHFLYSLEDGCYYDLESGGVVSEAEFIKAVGELLSTTNSDESSADKEQTVCADVAPAVEDAPSEPIKAAEPTVEDKDEPVSEAEAETGAEEPVEEKAVEAEEPVAEEKAEEKIEERVEEKKVAPKKMPSQPTNVAVDKAACYRRYLEMLASGDMYCATAYLKALSQRSVELNEEFGEAYTQLAYALNDPMVNCAYNSESVFNAFYNGQLVSEYFVVSAALRNFFLDTCKFDHALKSLYETVKGCELLKKLPELSEVLYELVQFKDTFKKGIDFYADHRQKGHKLFENRLAKIRNDARDIYENKTGSNVKEQVSLLPALEAKRQMFATNADLTVSLKAVSEDKRDEVDLISQFVSSAFIKNDESVNSKNIDEEKIGAYYDYYWSLGVEKCNFQKNMKCTGDVKSNNVTFLKKVVTILCDYVCTVDSCSVDEKDKGLIKYKKLRDGLIKGFKATKKALDSAPADSLTETAEKSVLADTVDECVARLDGTYVDNYNTFYYGFLTSDKVCLDENGLPILDDVSGIESLSAISRIEAHVSAQKRSFEERLTEICEGGEDLATAQMICNYLIDNGKTVSEKELDFVRNSYENIRKRAELKRDEFIGNIELANFYGQIDNTDEKYTEIYIGIMSYWYERASVDKNFGFFYTVADAILAKIRRVAQIRGENLGENLELYCKNNPDWEEKSDVCAAVKEIKNRIALQNYAAAEDLLNRLGEGDLFKGSINFVDYLAEFLKEYDTNLHNSGRADGKIPYKMPQAHNSNQKLAKQLLDNWPSGSGSSEVKIKNVLGLLGFKTVEKITKFDSIQRKDHYHVTFEAPKNGRKSNYTHPIYAFGSLAVEKGIRVVNMFGTSTADKLIATFKEIGAGKNTVILLDSPLSLLERRKLARLIKKDASNDVFMVIDRVALLYLVNHYEENCIGQMLMAITMPFSYCQPYIPESVRVMPPEIFIGRSENLKSIESVNGANIVYGGRQLGKSALLRMAQKNVNFNENGDRAVLVDINKKDVYGAARKISEQLYLDGIFDSEKDITENWDELEFKIKNSIDKKKIPYLLLLLDEADSFIESCMENEYRPFIALKNVVQSNGGGRFKFVVAGLRNIVRLNKAVALGNNSVLAHLSDVTIKPFRPSEARELLTLPLNYLGFRFEDNDKTEMLISNILSETNYFPGLLQLFCSKLIGALTKDYGGYDESHTPPYVINEKIIKKVLADEDLRTEIKEKFLITLGVGQDQYYRVIALLGAYQYSVGDGQRGFSVDDIKRVADDFGVGLINNTSKEQIQALMEEMKELNVFQKIDDTSYRFTRYNFYQMMGNKREIEDEILNYMEQ